MSSTSSTSSTSNLIRFSGMASGLDTESIIKQLMAAEKIPYTKLGQQKQLLQWTQDAYRAQSTLIMGFKSSYFDVLNSSSNMRSSSIYKQFAANSGDTSIATISGNSDAISGNHTLTVTQMATTSTLESADSVAFSRGAAITSVTVDSLATPPANSFTLTLGGTTTNEIVIPDGTYNMTNATQRANFIGNIQSAIDAKFGAGKINVAISSDNRLSFSSTDTSKSLLINVGSKDVLSKLGFNADADNDGTNEGVDLSAQISLTKTLSSLSNVSAPADGSTFKLTINGQVISISKDKTVSDLINAVNTSGAGVTMSFNSLTGKFKFETKATGVGSASAFNTDSSKGTVNLKDDGGLLTEIGLSGAAGKSTLTTGNNSQYTLDGVTMSSSSNTFTQDGSTYTLKGVGTTTVSLTQNVDAAMSKIKEFVSKYNDLITEIQGKLDDKYDKDYAPLTDDQKSAMSDTDIKAWETKAQTGLLHNDSILEGFLTDMRNAISEPTSATKYTFASIGISTGAWYDGGKLTIDEDKLRSALTNDIDGVTKLFTNESSKAYNPTDTSTNAATDRSQRYKENGIITRLYDIINDNVRTTAGKGKLLQKAGIASDTSSTNNTIYDSLKDITTRMSDMNDRLTDKENAYYKKFSALETYMNNMNSQSSWLSQQLSKM